jgi:YVTN family beta-propeller protein
MNSILRKTLLAGLVVLAGCATVRYGADLRRARQATPEDFLVRAAVGPLNDGTYVVATTQLIDPVGETVLFPGRPVDMALQPNGKLLAVKNMKSVDFIDIERKERVQSLPMAKSGASFCGLAWWNTGADLWVTNAEDRLYRASLGADGKFAWTDEYILPGPSGKDESDSGGIAIDEMNKLLYVAMSRNNTVGVFNLDTRTLDAQIPVGMAPYTVVLAGGKAFVTNWGGRRPQKGDKTWTSSGSDVVVDPKTGATLTGTVSVIDLKSRSVINEIAVGLHPSGVCLSKDQSRLYVANANSDTVSVINTKSETVIATYMTKPHRELPFGSAPNALTLSPDETSLYVSNGGNNCVAVVDLRSGKLRGLIPTGWYPSTLAFLEDGKTLVVANMKGVGGRDTKTNIERKKRVFAGMTAEGFNAHDHLGSISFITSPTPSELREYTTRVAVNMRLPMMEDSLETTPAPKRVVPVPTRPGEVSPIKHVLYIIKENRTYDQVFGDMKKGNGDPSLCMFGEEVTPNQHKLADEFVLLDNFYCSGVLSADGHQWATEAYVTDYIEKSFGDFTRSYPYDGDDAMAYSPTGFIWDNVLRHGLTFRNYGEFVIANIEPENAKWADIYDDYKNGTRNVTIRARAAVHTIEPYLCEQFIGFPGVMQDVYRAKIFIDELREFEKKGELPSFMIMLLPNNHTSGTREGMPTPRACVADNDLALGQIVEALSHSKFWPETAILVAEDDPQAGLDHVDGRRTIAQCISPYTKRGYVDSAHYTQPSLIRTIELILGLPPMNQFDLGANPMTGCFTETPDLTPYTAVPNRIPLDEMNKKLADIRGKERYWAVKSAEMPLDDIDKADEDTFNRVIWHSVKGYDVPYPKLANALDVVGEDEEEEID